MTDILALALLEAGQKDILRYYSPACKVDSVPDKLKGFANIHQEAGATEEVIREPKHDWLSKAQLVFCISAWQPSWLLVSTR